MPPFFGSFGSGFRSASQQDKQRRIGGSASRSRLRLAFIVIATLSFGLPFSTCAQRTNRHLVSGPELPDAPGMGSFSEDSGSPPNPPQGSGSISGTIVDTSAALVVGARVTLDSPAGAVERAMLSNDRGEFTFADLPPGAFRITIVAIGMEPYVSPQVLLPAGERRELPRIVLPIAAANADVTVVVTLDQLATEQVKAAEKQRVLGVFPNFYTSYIWNAAPLRPKHKFELAVRSLIDPVNFVTTGMAAGAEQAVNTFPGYGQGAEGYAKRYGAIYANEVLARMIGGAILPSLLHQDPRYFYQGSGSTWSRGSHAVSSTVVCKGDNGLRQFNYSRVLGAFATAGISNLYFPEADRGATLVLRNGLIGLAGNAAGNIVKEFFLRRLTPKVPDYEQGKP